jgi:hypothetical protein
MARAYNVVDADGHILEPLDLWDRYIDPELLSPEAEPGARRQRPPLLRLELTLAIAAPESPAFLSFEFSGWPCPRPQLCECAGAMNFTTSRVRR